MLRAAGPLSNVIETEKNEIRRPGGDVYQAGSNALVMLNRLAFPTSDGPFELPKEAEQALVEWAKRSDLGQEPKLVERVGARRRALLRTLKGRGYRVIRLKVEPEWRLAVGIGNRMNPHEIGFSLHGTYGWPTIPSSTLKGLVVAWAHAIHAAGAEDEEGARDEIEWYLGPRPGEQERQFAVCEQVRILDAIPLDKAVSVEPDVLTPHVKPYYDHFHHGTGQQPQPPAEYHQPVPVTFLTVSGVFAVDLYGTMPEAVNAVAGFLTSASEEYGVGAKTNVGYGYMKVTRSADEELDR